MSFELFEHYYTPQRESRPFVYLAIYAYITRVYDRTHIRPCFAHRKTRGTASLSKKHHTCDPRVSCRTRVKGWDAYVLPECRYSIRSGDDRNGAGTNTDHSPSQLYPNFAIRPFKNSVTYTAVPCFKRTQNRRIAYLL